MNMQSAVDVYNAPGVFLGNQAQLDLIRWYGLPSWHYAGHSDSKGLDEQWALELGIATILGALSRATLLHDVGYLESGLQSALEGLVLGDEVAGYARALLRELPVDDEALALAEIEAAGPGGNHLGHEDDAAALPGLLAGVADRPEHLRPLVRGRQPHAARARPGPRWPRSGRRARRSPWTTTTLRRIDALAAGDDRA